MVDTTNKEILRENVQIHVHYADVTNSDAETGETLDIVSVNGIKDLQLALDSKTQQKIAEKHDVVKVAVSSVVLQTLNEKGEVEVETLLGDDFVVSVITAA